MDLLTKIDSHRYQYNDDYNGIENILLSLIRCNPPIFTINTAVEKFILSLSKGEKIIYTCIERDPCYDNLESIKYVCIITSFGNIFYNTKVITDMTDNSKIINILVSIFSDKITRSINNVVKMEKIILKIKTSLDTFNEIQ